MQKYLQSQVVLTGLAVFAMFFGAGNLVYPILVGMQSGSHNVIGMSGFILTAVVLPVIGLIGMLLYNGDYEAFFGRLGRVPGKIAIGVCMLVIGPVIAIPRITTLSHTMLAPFIPPMSDLVFAILFFSVTFLCVFRENKIVGLLGKIFSPAKLLALGAIILWGLWTAVSYVPTSLSNWEILKSSLFTGYGTLDLLGAIFFSAIVINLLKIDQANRQASLKTLVKVGLQAGLIGAGLLTLVYLGLSYLSAFHSHGLAGVNPDVLFRELAFKVLGHYGAAVIGVVVMMGSLSTAIALTAVLGEYVQYELLRQRVSFAKATLLVLLSCIPLSIYGFSMVMDLTGGPIVYIGYPMLITLTLVNIAYKVWGFKPVKLPVLITGLVALISYLRISYLS